MPLGEVHPARLDEQSRGIRYRPVPLAYRTLVGGGAKHRVVGVNLSLRVAPPRRPIGVLEFRHADVRERVERMDDHLPVYRAGNVYAAILQVTKDWRHASRRRPHVRGLHQEVRHAAIPEREAPHQ